MPSIEPIWLPELVTMRGIAICAVVSLHCTGHLWWLNSGLQPNFIAFFSTFIWSLSIFAVPLFIVITGSSLSTKYFNKFSNLEFYRKRFITVIPPYLFFSCFYLINRIYIKKEISPEPAKILFRLLTGSSSFHLWFIPLVIIMYLFYPSLVFIYKKFGGNIKLLIILCFFTLLIGCSTQLLYSFIPDRYNLSANFYEALKILAMPANFLFFIPFILIGIKITMNIDNIRKIANKTLIKHRVALYFIAISLSSAFGLLQLNSLYQYILIPKLTNHTLRYFLNFTNSFIFIIIALDISIYSNNHSCKLNSLIKLFGKYSFGIFLVHIMFIDLFYIFLKELNITGNNITFYPALFFLTLFSSTFFIYKLSQFPWGNKLIGIKSFDKIELHNS
jgi:surface polysaccharide O-acyltransferase-like enzyme